MVQYKGQPPKDEDNPKYFCTRCRKTIGYKNFYTYKDGSKTLQCKKCFTARVNPFEPDTFLPLLEELDLPYSESAWGGVRDKYYLKNPNRTDIGTVVFGSYISRCRLTTLKDKCYADSDMINEIERKNYEKFLEENPAYKKICEEKKVEYERGQISKEEYMVSIADPASVAVAPPSKTSTSVPIPHNPMGNASPYDNIVDTSLDANDPILALTDNDKRMLTMKWGDMYKPDEWITLEKYYRDMCKDFGVDDTDSKSVLIFLSKTNLKMNQAIDIGDIETFQKLSKVFNDTRKTAKFTKAQVKDGEKDEKDDFSSVGELVSYCEKLRGAIQFEYKTSQDIVDEIIEDNHRYIKNLILEDPSILKKFQQYLKKAEHSLNEEKETKVSNVVDKVLVQNEKRLDDEAILTASAKSDSLKRKDKKDAKSADVTRNVQNYFKKLKSEDSKEGLDDFKLDSWRQQH